MLVYLILGSTALCAVLGAPWWVALAGGTLLALQSIFGQQRMRAGYVTADVSDILPFTQLASVATGWLAGGAAWLLGRTIVLLIAG